MRKITTFVAALAALALVSCNKNNVEQPSIKTNEGIELNLTIAGFDNGADTRAVKKDWTTGDKINLWFDDWNYNEKKVAAPDLVITYDGSKWTSSKFAEGRSPKTNGKFLAVYESRNDLMSESSNIFYNGSMWYYAAKINSESKSFVNYCDVYYMPMYISAQAIDYSFADNKLTATVSKWESHTNYKITVKGIPEGKYAMQVLNNPDTNVSDTGIKCDYAMSCSAICIDVAKKCPKAIGGHANSEGYTGGISESDGIAFYYNNASWHEKTKLENATIKFRLINLSDGKTLSYQVTNKTITLNERTNIALNYSSFTAE